MDPNATLDRIAYLLDRSAREFYAGEVQSGNALDYACQELYDWLAAGGFEPDWTRHESAAEYYRCRAVYHYRGERVDD